MGATTSGTWERVLDLAPFVVGFAAPVALLLWVYVSLRRRDARQA